MKSQLFLKAGAAAAALWIIALTVIHLLDSQQATAASVAAWVQKQDWNSLSANERARRLARLEDQMNSLSFTERQKVSGDRTLEPLTQQMTEDERLSLMDKTLPKGFAQLMDSFNKMKPEDRQRLVTRALENMKKWDPQQPRPAGWDDAAMQKVVQNGFSSYLQDASAETKLDLAPLIQQVQVDMQGMGN
jgi:hypothetical protein